MNHAADVTSRQAYQDLQADTGAVLVDVRTAQEWNSVGVPDVAGVVFAQWALGDGAANPRFLAELSDAAIVPDGRVYFLCRSGQRSRATAQAATAAGYRHAYNISDGFEGSPDPTGRRTPSGWKNNKLPWRHLP